MKRTTMGAVVGSVVAGAVATRFLSARQRKWPMSTRAQDRRRPRWHVVTINRPPDEVAPGGRLPEPIAKLGDEVEVQVNRAVGDRGTALAARLRREPSGITGAASRLAGSDPLQAVRAALRESKMLLETGEILQADKPGTAKHTITGRPLDLAISRARGEGRL
ncbi:hypothetical protein HC031_12315 [Planosporangium thailandense]|uniref:Uncharacterized protein n=1 Tax=Planosporangium thailandense TaxID=765197 RepID=A0ABX0XZ98_9ACTN|nr:hypothetical protein [Planosporangium thailandense]NJC70489.1 hypothetical protein [Planosporangium thailandense]